MSLRFFFFFSFNIVLDFNRFFIDYYYTSSPTNIPFFSFYKTVQCILCLFVSVLYIYTYVYMAHFFVNVTHNLYQLWDYSLLSSFHSIVVFFIYDLIIIFLFHSLIAIVKKGETERRSTIALSCAQYSFRRRRLSNYQLLL